MSWINMSKRLKKLAQRWQGWTLPTKFSVVASLCTIAATPAMFWPTGSAPINSDSTNVNSPESNSTSVVAGRDVISPQIAGENITVNIAERTSELTGETSLLPVAPAERNAVKRSHPREFVPATYHGEPTDVRSLPRVRVNFVNTAAEPLLVECWDASEHKELIKEGEDNDAATLRVPIKPNDQMPIDDFGVGAYCFRNISDDSREDEWDFREIRGPVTLQFGRSDNGEIRLTKVTHDALDLK